MPYSFSTRQWGPHDITYVVYVPIRMAIVDVIILTCFLVLADALEFTLWPIEVSIDPTRFQYGKQGEGVWTCKKF